MFINIAGKYDVMNNAMSLGIHPIWKDEFISSMALGPDIKSLDVAGETVDIALQLLDYCKSVHRDNTASATLVDINPHMIGEEEKRFKTTPCSHTNQVGFLV